MRNVIYISAKCNDMCSILLGYKDGREFYHIGNPPHVMGLMGGDYIDFGINLETGQINNWEVVKAKLNQFIHSDEVAWEEV